MKIMLFDDGAIPKWLWLWWILWIGCVVFLSIMLPFMDGTRVYLPYGQFLFFSLSIVTALVVIFFENKNLAKLLSVHFLAIIAVVFFAILPSILTGISPAYGLRLLVILGLTTVPFIIIGSYAVNRPVMIVIPILGVALVCAVGVILLQMFQPINIGPLKLVNHLHGTRWSFLFNEANALGAMMAIGLSASLYLLLIVRRYWVKTIIGAVVIPVMLFVFRR